MLVGRGSAVSSATRSAAEARVSGPAAAKSSAFRGTFLFSALLMYDAAKPKAAGEIPCADPCHRAMADRAEWFRMV